MLTTQSAAGRGVPRVAGGVETGVWVVEVLKVNGAKRMPVAIHSSLESTISTNVRFWHHPAWMHGDSAPLLALGGPIAPIPGKAGEAVVYVMPWLGAARGGTAEHCLPQPRRGRPAPWRMRAVQDRYLISKPI